MMERSDLDNWFTYHAPTDEQIGRYHRLRLAARAFADVVFDELLDSPDRSAAIRKIREAVMTANAGIACEVEKVD